MKLVFTLSAGRTGTAFLAELFAQNLLEAEVHHERVGFDSFGVDTPEVSDLMLYNNRGNVRKVQKFWERKLSRILRSRVDTYVETSHVLMKAGLVENSVRLCQGHELHFIRLRRAMVPTLLSYECRGDFLNKSSQWLWYLDDNYSRTFVKSDAFRRFGLHGLRLWYLMEIEFRATYFCKRYQDSPGVHFHQVDIEELNDPVQVKELLLKVGTQNITNPVIIPDRINVSHDKTPPDPDSIKALEQLVTGTQGMDPVATADEYICEKIDPFSPDEPSEDLWVS